MSFEGLFKDLDIDLIPSNQFYSAHVGMDGLELLEAHSRLCSEYFMYIVNELGLEEIIDNLIINVFGEENHRSAKQIILFGIYYHDIGKLNPNFQKSRVEKLKTDGITHHSFFSETVLSSFLIKEYPTLRSFIYLMGNIINRHHSRLNDFTTHEYDTSVEEKQILSQIFRVTNIDKIMFSEEDKRSFFRNDFERDKKYEIFLIVKLLYSLLVLSDSYSTMHYSESFKSMYPLNKINGNILGKMVESFSKLSYNTDIDCSEARDDMICNNINDLRKKILLESNINMKKLLKRGNKIFMLSVPTGGGKTNISMKMALNILEHDEKIKRLFYVFPFINIIEQNYKAIDDALFDKSLFPDKISLISDIYSRAYVDKFQGEMDEDLVSNLEKSMVIKDDNFLNNCVNVITNVNFFNAFIKKNNNDRYKIANLCNSVVIIDEIQTLNDKNLRIFYNFIEKTSKHLNIYYVIMSATLPDFNDFIDNVEVPQIIDDPHKYYNHPVFRRNEIIFKDEINDIDGIKALLQHEIDEYYKTGNVKILVTLNVVNTSRKVYDDLKDDKYFKDFSFYLLNSTISGMRRKKLIEEIKDKSKEERIIIVSTQSIEAGVDIDCDFGIRDYSILDSIEQISGRINRECDAKKAGISKLFVINYKDGKLADSEKIYGKQERYKILSKRSIAQGDIIDILNHKHFDKYYNALSVELKKVAKDSFRKIENMISNLRYKAIHDELDVIENNNIKQIDVFVCEEILLEKLSRYDKEKIENLINDSNIRRLENEYDIRIISDGKINTGNVYKIWEGIISSTNKFEEIYVRKKVTSLLNQFIISINNIKNRESGQELLSFFVQNGYVDENKFDIITSTPKFSEFYSFEDGLRTDKLKEIMNETKAGIII